MRDAAFVLTGAGTWVGKPAYFAVDPLTIQEGQREIAWAVTEHWIKGRGPRHPHMNLSTPQPFRFDLREILLKRTLPEMLIKTIKYCLPAFKGPEL